jgi:hypothetical protein
MATQDYISNVEVIASRIMYELLGRRWVWPAVTTTEEIALPPGQSFVYLSGRPVSTITSVTSDVDPTTQIDYTLVNGYRLEMKLAGTWTGDNGPYWSPFPFLPPCTMPKRIVVTYTYGSPPPASVGLAIDFLADQFRLLLDGSDECKLPERVKSISRQGISMDIVSPMDFLNDGRTGIAEVDEVLMAFNPSKARRPARVISQVLPPPRRHGTTQANQ